MCGESLPVSPEEGTEYVAEYPEPLVRFVPSVLHDLYPGGVVAGQSYRHGRHRVLHYGQQLDVAQVEIVLVAKSASCRLEIFFFDRTELLMSVKIQQERQDLLPDLLGI